MSMSVAKLSWLWLRTLDSGLETAHSKPVNSSLCKFVRFGDRACGALFGLWLSSLGWVRTLTSASFAAVFGVPIWQSVKLFHTACDVSPPLLAFLSAVELLPSYKEPARSWVRFCAP